MSKAHLPGDPHPEPGQLTLENLARRKWTESEVDLLPTPTTRAGYALGALLDHDLTTTGGNRKEQAEDSLRGMLADVFHLCDALQIDWDTVVDAARTMYRDEV